MEDARRITAEQKVVLDKIRHLHRFFEDLEALSDCVKEVRDSASLQSVHEGNTLCRSTSTLKVLVKHSYFYTEYEY